MHYANSYIQLQNHESFVFILNTQLINISQH